MGLLKLAAIVAVGVSLLPSDREKQEQLYARAANAATWTLTFCDRNAETCNKMQTFWAEFSKKAEFGAKLAYDVMRENGATGDATERLSAPASFEAPAAERPIYRRSGTLTPQKMAIVAAATAASRAGRSGSPEVAAA